MRFLKSKRNENLADSTIDKLKTIFERQFLSWATESRLKHLEDITTADLEAFRDTWEDGLSQKQNLVRGSRFKTTSSLLAVTMQRVFNDGICCVNGSHFLHLNKLTFQLLVILKKPAQHE